MNHEALNGQTIKLGQLFELIKDFINNGYQLIIPNYQRNYKWNAKIAVKLSEDLINSFNSNKTKSLAIFTLYIHERDKKIHIIDGQQRMITLLLIFAAVEKYNEFPELNFERDNGIINDNRKTFLKFIGQKQDVSGVGKSDKRRFLYNYKEIKKCIDRTDICKSGKEDEFIKFLKENLNILLHITKISPVSEFLNMNCNKEPFRVCDKVRAYLLIYMSAYTELLNVTDVIDIKLEEKYKEKISNLFEEIMNMLYSSNKYPVNTMFDYIGKGYKIHESDNRLNILFTTYLNNREENYQDIDDNAIEEQKLSIIQRIYLYKRMLEELKNSLERDYRQTANQVLCLYALRKVKFFELLDEFIDNEKKKSILVGKEKIDSAILAKIIDQKFSIEHMVYNSITMVDKGKKVKNTDEVYDIENIEVYNINRYFDVFLYNFSDADVNGKSEFREIWDGKAVKNDEFFPIKPDDVVDMINASGRYFIKRYHKVHDNEEVTCKIREVTL